MWKVRQLMALVLLCALADARGADLVKDGLPGPVGAGDLISVTIYDLVGPGKGATFPVRVDGDGKASLPHVGQVQVGGRTTDRAASAVSGAYRDAKLIENAVVTVGVLESGSAATVKPGPLNRGDRLRITIYGLVAQLQQPTTVLAMIGDDGSIELPVAGELKLAGLTEAEADKAIATLYRERGAVQGAIVSVLRLAPAAGT